MNDEWDIVITKRYHNHSLPAHGSVFGEIVPNETLGDANYNVFSALTYADEAGETGKPIVSFSEAAAKMDPSDFTAILANRNTLGDDYLWKLLVYLEKAFSQVSPLPWVKLLKELPLSKLIHDHVSLCHIPISVYHTAADWLKRVHTSTHLDFVTMALGLILRDWERLSSNAVPTFVGLVIVLRCSKPDFFTTVLRMLRWNPSYQGQDKLPVLVWILAQATLGDLSAGLYSWAHVLLPLVGSYRRRRPRSIDLILQFVESILSDPEAPTVLLINGAVREGELLIPPSSFEILVRLTFPALSARVKATKRFEAVYPFLKEVAFAPGGNASEQIFTFSLKLAGEANPGLAKEAASIAIRSLTENVDCFEHWDFLYTEHLEASVALLRKLVDEWKDHSPKLLPSPGHATLAVNQTMRSFRLKNGKAITEGAPNCSLYKEADGSCKLILRRLSCESAYPIITHMTAMVLATCAGSIAGAALALSYH